MSDSRHFILSHDTARRTAAACCMLPEYAGYSVKIEPPTRNLEQNAKLWAMLGEISAQVDWYGQKLTDENWKDIFTASLKKEKIVPGLDGGFVVLGQRTSKMSKKDFSELLELALAFATQKRVKLHDQG